MSKLLEKHRQAWLRLKLNPVAKEAADVEVKSREL